MANTATGARAAQAFTDAVRRNPSMQVSGDLVFEPFRWREAILYYLNGVWSGNQKVMYRPKISLGNVPAEDSVTDVVLRLDPDACDYYAYGTSVETHAPRVEPHETLAVGSGGMEVEGALIRFVRNDRWKLLTITFPHRQGVGRVFLWKTGRRSELRVGIDNMPKFGESTEIKRFY